MRKGKLICNNFAFLVVEHHSSVEVTSHYESLQRYLVSEKVHFQDDNG